MRKLFTFRHLSRSSKWSFGLAGVLFLNAIYILCSGFFLQLGEFSKSLDACALAKYTCLNVYNPQLVLALIYPLVLIIIGALLASFRNKLMVQVLLLWLAAYFIYVLILSQMYLVSLLHPLTIFTLLEILLASVAYREVGGLSISSQLPISRFGVGVFAGSLVALTLSIYLFGPTGWRHYQDYVQAQHLDKSSAMVRAAIDEMPVGGDPDKVGRESGANIAFIPSNSYQLCGQFNYDTLHGAAPVNFIHHAKGRYCLDYPVAENKLYKKDVRIDKNMLVTSRFPEYQFSAISLASGSDGKIQSANIGNLYDVYNSDGSKADISNFEVGDIVTCYWQTDYRQKDTYVYKVVIERSTKEYISPLQNLAISFPATWSDNGYIKYTTRGVQYEDQQFHQPVVDVNGVKISSTVQFDSTDGADTGLSSSVCTVNCEVAQVIPLNMRAYSGLSIVVTKTNGAISGMAVTDRIDITPGARISSNDLYFASNAHTGGRVSVRISYSYPHRAGDQSVRSAYLTDSQYLNPELSRVPLAILQSLIAK